MLKRVLALAFLIAFPGLAAPPPCTVKAARAAAPPGMKVGPITDLNPNLPRVATGAKLVRASATTPAYCLVTATVVTNADTQKTANFGIALPRRWNKKFLFSGCGGLCGVVFQVLPNDSRGGGFPPDALRKGYAIAATDDGHNSETPDVMFDGSWAMKERGVPDEDALTDYFYRAVHAVTVSGKQFVQRWYSGDLARSYYFGCSNGGREAMVEAARFPEDFDGYVAGAPSFDLPGQILAGRAARALLDAADSFIPSALLARVDKAIYANCDAADGVRDNLIQNPAKCSFKPVDLLCKGGDRSHCLTENQIATMDAWFAAAKSEDGRVVSFGFAVSDVYGNGKGPSLFSWAEGAGPPRDRNAAEPWGTVKSKQAPGWLFYDQSLKYLVFLDPHFDNNQHSAVDRRGVVNDASLSKLEERTAAGRGDDPRKLGPFVAADRKLILYHGYSDGFVNPFRTIQFYEDWAKLSGGYESLRKNARLFMVPGMHHCHLGPGPNFLDAIGALEQWVEHGYAPRSIIATKYLHDNRFGPVLRTLPLCPFPAQARYSGKGDVNNGDLWSCTDNQDLLQVGPNGALAGLSSP